MDVIRKYIQKNPVIDFDIEKDIFKTVFEVGKLKIPIKHRFVGSEYNAAKYEISCNNSSIKYQVPDNHIQRNKSKYVSIGTNNEKGESSDYRTSNIYRCTNGEGADETITYRFGTKITNDSKNSVADSNSDEMSKIISGIVDKIDSGKKILCVSLLTPCNMMVCSEVAQKIINKATKNLNIFFREAKVLETELGVNKITDKITVISIPIAMNSKFGIGIYDHDKHIKNASDFPILESDSYKNKDDIKEIYKLIDMSNNENSFQSIVKFAEYYYNNRSKYVLVYHCKSGKDRTSVFDAIVQSTIYCLRTNGNINYNLIKKYTRKMLVFGLMISYYGTGGIGLKIGTVPLAKWILSNREYVKYKGNSDNFMKSA
jgi:hypothetical protein